MAWRGVACPVLTWHRMVCHGRLRPAQHYQLHRFLQLPTHDVLHTPHLPVLALEERQEIKGEQEGGLQGGRLADEAGASLEGR